MHGERREPRASTRHAFAVAAWGLLAVVQAAVGAAWLAGADTAPGFLAPSRAGDVALGVFLLATFPVQAVVAAALARRRPWARPVAFAAAVPGMLAYPVGTILCAVAVLELLQPEAARALAPG